MPGYSLYDFGDFIRFGANEAKEEIALFAESGMLMTYECGIRFLTDFLNGDTYFKISYPNHNLVRAKDQFALVEDMKKKLPQMRELVKEYL